MTVIELDRERHLHFSLGSFRAAYEKSNGAVNALDPRFWGFVQQRGEDFVFAPSPQQFIDILWSGLIHEDAELTREQLEAWLDANFSAYPRCYAVLAQSVADLFMRKDGALVPLSPPAEAGPSSEPSAGTTLDSATTKSVH